MKTLKTLWKALETFISNEFPPLSDYDFAGTGGYLW